MSIPSLGPKKNIPSGGNKPHRMVEFVDGNNNHYAAWVMPVMADPWIICAAYDPITPAESSSGRYSGGQAIFIQAQGGLTRDDYEELEEVIIEKMKSKDGMVEERRMGTGILDAPDQETLYVSMGSYGDIEAAFGNLFNKAK